MPAYPWLITDDGDYSDLETKISVMRKLGVPYEEGYEEYALEELNDQAQDIADFLSKEKGIRVAREKEIISLIAYLHKLGRDINTKKIATSEQ